MKPSLRSQLKLVQSRPPFPILFSLESLFESQEREVPVPDVPDLPAEPEKLEAPAEARARALNSKGVPSEGVGFS